MSFGFSWLVKGEAILADKPAFTVPSRAREAALTR